MNKREKKFYAQLPGGVGANVVDHDLGTALRVWKQDLKQSGKLKEVFNRREFQSPSQIRREIVESAKYKRKFQNT